LLFSTNNQSVKYTDLDNPGDWEVGKQRFSKLDVPILAGLKLGHFRVAGGPVFTAHVNSKSDLLTEHGLEYHYKNATVGYQLGAGFEWDSFSIELRYEDNLSDYGTAMKVGNRSFATDDRASQLMLTMAVFF
ncbi:MAG: PorT family protein, partial [Bacteroidales bacterium]|nr:PorT family protein [Bacteroidales bacterium]